MSEILVSVIIPAYNCAKTIQKAIDSALGQAVPVEILVLNDCSKEPLKEAMRPYAADSRVRYIVNAENLGAAETRNKGVRLAQGEYIAFLDADDYWAEDKLKKQLDLMEKTGCVLCSTARELMQPDGTLSGYTIPVPERFTFRSLCKGNVINCSSVLMRRAVALEFPMEHEDCHEDYLMWLRVLQKYGEGCAVNEPLLKYRVSNTGKSGSKLHSSLLAWRTYRYMGFSLPRSIYCFLNYAFGGVKKYLPWFLNSKQNKR